jgi:hypothetical protein
MIARTRITHVSVMTLAAGLVAGAPDVAAQAVEARTTPTARGAVTAGAPRSVGADRDLGEMQLLASEDSMAVVRFGDGALEILRLGDRVGRYGARVAAIDAGRVVLDEVFPGTDGRPNRARVVLRDGQRGGTRYLARLEATTPPATRRTVAGTRPADQRTPHASDPARSRR